MVKHTQTIRWQIADELFERVWSFCEIGAKRVKNIQLVRIIIKRIVTKFSSDTGFTCKL